MTGWTFCFVKRSITGIFIKFSDIERVRRRILLHCNVCNRVFPEELLANVTSGSVIFPEELLANVTFVSVIFPEELLAIVAFTIELFPTELFPTVIFSVELSEEL